MRCTRACGVCVRWPTRDPAGKSIFDECVDLLFLFVVNTISLLVSRHRAKLAHPPSHDVCCARPVFTPFNLGMLIGAFNMVMLSFHRLDPCTLALAWLCTGTDASFNKWKQRQRDEALGREGMLHDGESRRPARSRSRSRSRARIRTRNTNKTRIKP